MKPTFVHFLMLALERGYIRSVDEPVAEWEPRLRTLNPNLGAHSNVSNKHMSCSWQWRPYM